MRLALVKILTTAVLVVACNTGSKNASPDPSPPPATTPAPTPAPTSNEGALRLGAPIEGNVQKVSLADVAKTPNTYVGKTFTTTGTVTAVCQHMGCWMEIKDDSAAGAAAGEAHIKMAGHAFLVPKTASGRKARVLAKLVKTEPEKDGCGEGSGEGHEGMSAAASADGKPHPKNGCRAEAEAQLGRPLAKLELVAEGVELM